MRKPAKGLRTSAFWASLSKIMKSADMRELQQAMLAQLRDGTLHPALRGFCADELELFWFPSPHRERAQRRQALAHAYREDIRYLVEEKRLSKKKAEAKAAALNKKTVPAMKQFLKRAKAEARDLRRGS